MGGVDGIELSEAGKQAARVALDASPRHRRVSPRVYASSPLPHGESGRQTLMLTLTGKASAGMLSIGVVPERLVGDQPNCSIGCA